MIYHIVAGNEAASPLNEAIAAAPAMTGKVVILRDTLNVGPLDRADGQSFSALRTEWWQQIAPNEQHPIEVDDLERLLEVSNELYKNANAVAWYWMAPSAVDVCAYYWMLPFLAKHQGRFLIVNLANLPFLDEERKVFYPKKIAEILPRELHKARRLARPVTSAEAELGNDVWSALSRNNNTIRTLEGGKKLLSHREDLYDADLLGILTTTAQKASRLLHLAATRQHLPVSGHFLAWRLRTLAASGAIIISVDHEKPLREWEAQIAEAAPTAAGLSLTDAV